MAAQKQEEQPPSELTTTVVHTEKKFLGGDIIGGKLASLGNALNLQN